MFFDSELKKKKYYKIDDCHDKSFFYLHFKYFKLIYYDIYLNFCTVEYFLYKRNLKQH